MQTGFTEDQIQFREVVARFMQEKAGPQATRKLMETESGYDVGVWQQMCAEVGLAGTHIPEAYGGFGFGIVELGIALEEMGRHIYTGPFFASSVMASSAPIGNPIRPLIASAKKLTRSDNPTTSIKSASKSVIKSKAI